MIDDLRTAAFAAATDPEALVDDLVTVELRMLYADFPVHHPDE
jgi:hypothetical protein